MLVVSLGDEGTVEFGGVVIVAFELKFADAVVVQAQHRNPLAANLAAGTLVGIAAGGEGADFVDIVELHLGVGQGCPCIGGPLITPGNDACFILVHHRCGEYQVAGFENALLAVPGDPGFAVGDEARSIIVIVEHIGRFGIFTGADRIGGVKAYRTVNRNFFIGRIFEIAAHSGGVTVRAGVFLYRIVHTFELPLYESILKG